MPKKQSDGRYRAKITVGHAADGKPVVKYVSGRTRRELEEAKQAAISYYVDGTAGQKDRLFCEYATEWYCVKKEPHLSDISNAGYRSMLNKHILPAFEGRMLRAIRYADIQAWLNEFAGMSKSQITLSLTIMRGIMGSAFAEGIIPRDPTISLARPKTTPPKEKRALTDGEKKAILETISRHENGPFLAVLYYLGVRRGEAAGLQWGDFDWQDGVVHIQRDIDFSSGNKGKVDDLKSRAADRQVTIPHELRAILYPIRSLPHVFLFLNTKGEILSLVTLDRMWMSLMIDAGLVIKNEPDDGKAKEVKKRRADIRYDYKALITPHYLRHNYVTMLYEAGVDPMVAMRLVGHADYQTTANIYTHLSKAHLDKASDKINAVFDKKLPESCR